MAKVAELADLEPTALFIVLLCVSLCPAGTESSASFFKPQFLQLTQEPA